MKRAVARSSTYTLDTASRAPLLFCCCCNQNELMSTSRIVSTSTRDHRPLTTTSMDRRQQQQQLMLMPTIMTRSYLHFGEQNLTTIKLINLRSLERKNPEYINFHKSHMHTIFFSLLDNTTNYPVVGCIIQNRKHPEKSHVFGYLVCGWWSNFENGRLWKWIMWEG